MNKSNLYLILKSNLNRFLKNAPNNKVLISLSGGVDSMVLLDLVNRYSSEKQLIIFNLHFNYNMQDNSDKAENFCRYYCEVKKNKFKSISVNLSNKNFESQARELRYNELYKYAYKHKISIVLTAHHQDDQIETLYMNSKFNSDWISKVGIRDEIDIVKRPFLSFTKKQILSYADKNNISYVFDLSNNDNKYLRNNIRNNILPSLNHSEIDKLLKDCKKYKNKYQKLIEKVGGSYDKYIQYSNSQYVQIDKNISHLTDLVEFKFYIKKIIHITLGGFVNATQYHWIEMRKFINNSKSGSNFYINNEIAIINDRASFYVYNCCFFNELKSNIEKNFKIQIFGNKVKWYNSEINLKNIGNQLLYIRHWKAGDRYYSNYYKKYLKVSDLFVNQKIPKFKKYLYPIIVDNDDHILNIPSIYNNFSNKIKVKWNFD